MKTPGVAPAPSPSLGRDMGQNATRIRQRRGFILARNKTGSAASRFTAGTPAACGCAPLLPGKLILRIPVEACHQPAHALPGRL